MALCISLVLTSVYSRFGDRQGVIAHLKPANDDISALSFDAVSERLYDASMPFTSAEGSCEVKTRGRAITWRRQQCSWVKGFIQSEWGQPTRWEDSTYRNFDRYMANYATHYVGFGTWVGVTLLYAAQYASVRHAVGIEADPAAFGAVTNNLRLNAHRSWAKKVEVYPVAVRMGTGKQKLRLKMQSAAAGNSCSGLKAVACGNVAVTWKVDAYTLPNILHRGNIPVSPHLFVKVDVESYECELLGSWVPWLRLFQAKPTFHIAFHGPTVRKCSAAQYAGIQDFAALFKTVIDSTGKLCDIEDLPLTLKNSALEIVFTDR